MLLDLLEEILRAHKSATTKESPKSCVGKYICISRAIAWEKIKF